MTLTVRLDATLDAALQRHSAERGVTKSHVVQEALAEYLVVRRPAKAGPPRTSANHKAFVAAGMLGAGELGGTGATNAVVRERARSRLQVRTPR